VLIILFLLKIVRVSKVTLIGPSCQLRQHAILNVNTQTYIHIFVFELILGLLVLI